MPDDPDQLEAISAQELAEYLRERLVEAERRIQRLSKALDAATDIGIYPAVFVGKYEKRTDFMEGWNAHAIEAIKAAQQHLVSGDWKNNEPESETLTPTPHG